MILKSDNKKGQAFSLANLRTFPFLHFPVSGKRSTHMIPVIEARA